MLFVVISAVALNTNSQTLIAYDQKKYDIDIPATNAVEALNALALQTGVVMLFPYQAAKDRLANTVVGRYTLKVALTKLLQGSGLVSNLTNDGVIEIHLDGAIYNDEGMGMNSKKNLLASTIAFFVGVWC